MRRFETSATQKMSDASGWNGGSKALKAAKAKSVKQLPTASSRPGEWRKMLVDRKPSDRPERGVPAVLEDEIVERTSDGENPRDIEDNLSLNRGTVKRILLRRFGGAEQMKKAIELQCLENALLFNDHAANNMRSMTGGQAAIAAKVSIDGALAIGKDRIKTPETIDFDALFRLGTVLERVEKRLTSADVREIVSPDATH